MTNNDTNNNTKDKNTNNNTLKKYCKIINKETKEVQIGLGTNIDFYKSIGFEEKEIVEVDNRYYLKDFEPKPNINNIKKEMLNNLKINTENYFYNNYPQCKQNNIAIFGTEEEKEEFKKFHDDVVSIYDLKVRQINETETEEQLNKIKIDEDEFEKSPF